MQTPCIEPLTIDDNNKVNDSITTLIAVVEGQDTPSEVVLHDASIDPLRSVVVGENLQNAEVEGSIMDGLFGHIFN
jgi:hypothetical protein